MELMLMLGIVMLAMYGGKKLAEGSEQEVYDAFAAEKGSESSKREFQQTIPTVESYSSWRKLQYAAMTSAPPVEEKPWVPIYCEPVVCGDCTCGSWLFFGVVLIGSLIGLHFYLV